MTFGDWWKAREGDLVPAAMPVFLKCWNDAVKEAKTRTVKRIRQLAKRRWPDSDGIQHGVAEHIAGLIETGEIERYGERKQT